MNALPSLSAGMKAKRLLLLTLMTPVALGSTAFQPLDRVEGWLIERRLDELQEPICRASVPGHGTWFSARVRLDADGRVVVPDGLHRLMKLRSTQFERPQRCRASVLYL